MADKRRKSCMCVQLSYGLYGWSATSSVLLLRSGIATRACACSGCLRHGLIRELHVAYLFFAYFCLSCKRFPCSVCPVVRLQTNMAACRQSCPPPGPTHRLCHIESRTQATSPAHRLAVSAQNLRDGPPLPAQEGQNPACSISLLKRQTLPPPVRPALQALCRPHVGAPR